ncbi:hypothetical protein WN944_015048 [Citrus x changshan-huyou]|uniref:Transmembrane protein n=1 Tax=Citrus x changshan-huyou TaxID=2935761 RepID=A0AAP0MBR5_9ROSI
MRNLDRFFRTRILPGPNPVSGEPANPDPDIIYFNINFFKLLNINRKKKRRNPSPLNLSFVHSSLKSQSLSLVPLSISISFFNFSSQSLICSTVPLSISLTRFSLNLSHSLFNSRNFSSSNQILCGVAVITFTVRLCLFHQHHLSHLSLYRGQQKGVDFAAVLCGQWGWISRLCVCGLWGWIWGLFSVACGGGFRGCVLWPVGVDFAAVLCGLWWWISRPVGVDFAAVFCGLWGWISRLLSLF